MTSSVSVPGVTAIVIMMTTMMMMMIVNVMKNARTRGYLLGPTASHVRRITAGSNPQSSAC